MYVPKCLELDVLCSKMPGDRCAGTRQYARNGKFCLLAVLPSDLDRRPLLIRAFRTHEDGIKSHMCIQRHRRHRFSAETVWESRGSATAAHRISSSVSSAYPKLSPPTRVRHSYTDAFGNLVTLSNIDGDEQFLHHDTWQVLKFQRIGVQIKEMVPCSMAQFSNIARLFIERHS